MNTHFTLYSPAIALKAPEIKNPISFKNYEDLNPAFLATKLLFRKITPEDMPRIWNILKEEKGRTTDFSYGGLLMWVDYFHYEFAIVNDTLFIKGRVESDISKIAFSLPVGKLPLPLCVNVLKEYCKSHNLPLILSAVPEYAIGDITLLSPSKIEQLSDWGDYLYSAQTLATLSGKKMSKKRNHVNQFINKYQDYKFEKLTLENVDEIMDFMDIIDSEGDNSEMAIIERNLNRKMLNIIKSSDENLIGALLRDNTGKILAFTIGDIKGDTLFIHIEKASREVAGGFEMINKCFAEEMLRLHPEIEYINREDDSGDEGLRRAKESYHPLEILQKYNVVF